MIPIQMNAITRYHKGFNSIVHVPSGWNAQVPNLFNESDVQHMLEIYAKYYVSCGNQTNKAYQLAQWTMQATYNQGYTKGLREAVARHAAEYAEMWPAHMIRVGKAASPYRGKPIVELKGFVAANVQMMYVPFQNTGRAGQDYVKALLADMGRQDERGQEKER
mgnify:CR=1 FL=1